MLPFTIQLSRPAAFLLLVATALSSASRAQTSAAATKVAIAVRADRAPALENMDDPGWSSGATVSDFRQREPQETRPATERTVVHILYDKRFLYLAIECGDSRPRKIVATELRRDGNYQDDDHFSVLISPNNDRRNGYVFTINPLGTQFDALIADQGAVEDPNWDGVWRSWAKITNSGWVATMAIPFSTLNFKTSEEVTLGINFRRFIRSKNEEDLWQSYLRIYGLNRVSESGQLTGLKEIGSGRLLIIKPYLLGGVQSGSGIGTSMLHTAGLDLKYGIRSNLVANLTVNTDFAEADVDPVQFNLTPFKIFVPEKRQFFLENGGFFQFGTAGVEQLFFSRQIGIDPVTGEVVPLDVGGKVTGTLGKFELGVLDVKTRATGPNPYANYFVARLKRSLFQDSYVGAIVTDKRSGDPTDGFNTALGLDADLRFFRKLELQGYWAKTSSALPQLAGKDWTYSTYATYEDNRIRLEVGRREVQPNFNPEAGFIDRTDLITNLLGTDVKFRPATGPVRQVNLIGFYQVQPDTAGVVQTQEWQGSVVVQFQNGGVSDNDIAHSFMQRLTQPFNIFGNVVIPPGDYHFDRHQFNYSSDPGKRLSFAVTETFGTFYDGRLNEFAVSTTIRPNARIAIAGSESWDRFHLPEAATDVHISSVNLSYSFNRFLTTSALTQVNSVDSDPVSVNLRLRYNYRPDSDLFVIYTLGSQFNSLVAGNPVPQRLSRFTVKFTYSWSR